MKHLFLLMLLAVSIIACENREKTGGNDPDVAENRMLQELITRADNHPDSIQFRVDVIDTMDSLGRFQEALQQMAILLKKDSINNSYWSRNALLLERSGDTTAAIESYIRSVNIYPDPVTQLYLANLLAERQDDRSLLLVTQVSNTMSDDVTQSHCDFIAGIYHARRGNRKMAETLFNSAINRNRKYMEAYLEKGFLYFDAREYEEALKIFRLAAAVEPTYADAFYWQGKTYEGLGQLQDAANMYDQALRLDPDLAEASRALMRIRAQRS